MGFMCKKEKNWNKTINRKKKSKKCFTRRMTQPERKEDKKGEIKSHEWRRTGNIEKEQRNSKRAKKMRIRKRERSKKNGNGQII